MFRFANPSYFLLLIPVMVCIWLIYRRNIKSGILFAPAGRINVSQATWRIYSASLLPLLLIAGLILSVLALARPQTVFSTKSNSSNALAIEMVLDVSGSMEALDMSIKKPTGTIVRTRLDAVKDTFAEFVKKRPEDLIGIVTFGGYASTRAPLTSDHNALLHVLKGVEIPKPGLDSNGQVVDQEETLTAIGDALATACARLENAVPISKVIVLLSDGESNTGIIKPSQAMQVAQKMGIKVYTIGIGSSGRAPFKVKDMFGRETIQHANVSLDEKLLKKIASTCGGEYFNAQNPKGLEKAITSIDKLEKTEIKQDVYNLYNELFPWYLLSGMALLIVSCGLNMLITNRIV